MCTKCWRGCVGRHGLHALARGLALPLQPGVLPSARPMENEHSSYGPLKRLGSFF